MASDEYEDDDVIDSDDDIENALNLILGVDADTQDSGQTSRKKLSARTRIEDYMERRRLLEDGIDIDFDDD
jgi:hypothetical protein